MIFEYAEGGDFNNRMNKNYKDFNWLMKLSALTYISKGLREIHKKQMVHRDFHTGNILFKVISIYNNTAYISDMGSCGEIDNVDETKIYGVMSYVAPELKS
jgi:serine/threonine protein kinase